jgi:dipeptidyl aminopeptidase/acylaminoacyl peptidase
MRRLLFSRWVGVIIMIVMAACQPQQSNEPLPTLAPTLPPPPPPTATRPPLPATWTPSPSPAASTVEATTAALVSPTAAKVSGVIFYIFNGDSIAALAADGSSENLIHVGGAPAGLSLSPDGKLLAYVAQAGGSAREVYVIGLDGIYNQRVSCLGFPRVFAPVWRPDGKTLAFAASQTSEGALGIYETAVAGSGNCPKDNHQHLIAQLQINQAEELAWDRKGEKIFITSRDIYAVNASSGELYPQVTFYSGFGPDFSLAPNPIQDELYYLKTDRDSKTNVLGGTIFHIDTTLVGDKTLKELRGAPYFARRIRWSNDGTMLLIGTPREVLIQSQATGNTISVIKTSLEPQPVFSPDTDLIAYVDGGKGSRSVAQIYVVNLRGESPKQITNHKEGTIANLNWSAAS